MDTPSSRRFTRHCSRNFAVRLYLFPLATSRSHSNHRGGSHRSREHSSSGQHRCNLALRSHAWSTTTIRDHADIELRLCSVVPMAYLGLSASIRPIYGPPSDTHQRTKQRDGGTHG